MSFDEFLFLTGLMTKETWSKVQCAQNRDTHVTPKPSDVMFGKSPTGISRPLFGTVLKSAEFKHQLDAILQAAKVESFEDLLRMHFEWHLHNLVPLATYNQTLSIGRQIFEEFDDKRRVAKFLCTHSTYHDKEIIRDADTVAIPDGTSSLFVGLATAAFRANASIITSNDQLIREFRENPAVAEAFSDFHIIGGRADKKGVYGGTFEPVAQAAFEAAIGKDPAATVLIIPVSGINPEEGPMSSDGWVRKLRVALIEQAIKSKVREIVFVADYRKLLKNNNAYFGSPILGRGEWTKLIKEYGPRVSIVTTPTPTIRQAVESGALDWHIMRRDLRNYSEGHAPLEPADLEYHKNAKRFCEMWIKSHYDAPPRFYEAVFPSQAVATNVPAPA